MSTPSGIPIVDCDACGHRHPVTRAHCPDCGLASFWGHERCTRQGVLDLGAAS